MSADFASLHPFRTLTVKPVLWASLLLATATTTSVLAAMPSITVSTNNTPQDRRVLAAVSREAFKRLGLDFALVSLPSERSLQSADNGEVDVDMHIYLHRKHELLVPRLVHALREMKNDGTHGRVLASFGFD